MVKRHVVPNQDSSLLRADLCALSYVPSSAPTASVHMLGLLGHLSLSSIDYWRAGTSPIHLYVLGAEHSDQQVIGQVHACMSGSFSTSAWEPTTSLCFAFSNRKPND